MQTYLVPNTFVFNFKPPSDQGIRCPIHSTSGEKGRNGPHREDSPPGTKLRRVSGRVGALLFGWSDGLSRLHHQDSPGDRPKTNVRSPET